MGSTKVAALAALRERIRVLEDRGQVQKRRVASGVDLVDQLVQGLPQPGILELSGPSGSGCTRLALQLAAAAIAQGVGRMAAWVDWQRTLFPPALTLFGVDLASLLIIRPPTDQGTWAAEQLLRSGC
ncbi:MAG: recombinase RecA, partial [Proteobacteria bacterium]|nr:recombinase RecA [Pseudomonadota bacterium]